MSEKWVIANLPSRTEQYEAKRAALIQQAALAFKSRGFYATSMDDISTAVGVTKGALYRYVKNKQEILFECFKATNLLGDEALQVAERSGKTGLEKLRCFIIHFVSRYVEKNMAGAAMIDLDALFPDQRDEIIASRDRVDRALRKIVVKGIKDGSIVDRDPKLTIFIIMGAINWMPTWYSSSGEASPEHLAALVADLFTNGLAA